MSKLISIEGNIGVGKSTFTNILKELPNVDIVFEPVDMWSNIKDNNTDKNILETFYTDMPRWSYTFQNVAYITRVMNMENRIRESKNAYIFLDRSLETDKYVFEKTLHDDGLINDIEHNAYNLWFDFYYNYVRPKQDVYRIYLNANVDTCYKRIHIRDRSGEEKVSKEYLSKLEKCHNEWLQTEKHVLTLDCNQDFEHNQDIQNDMIEQVKKFINY